MIFSSNFFLNLDLIRCFRELNVRKFRKFSPDHFYDENPPRPLASGRVDRAPCLQPSNLRPQRGGEPSPSPPCRPRAGRLLAPRSNLIPPRSPLAPTKLLPRHTKLLPGHKTAPWTYKTAPWTHKIAPRTHKTAPQTQRNAPWTYETDPRTRKTAPRTHRTAT